MAMSKVTLRFTGEQREPLILHNGLLADPSYEWTRKIKEISGARKKTDAQHEQLAMMEFLGSLYWDDETECVYLPGVNVRRALLNAARTSREGKRIERGLVKISRINPLRYAGGPCKSRVALWEDERFRHRAMVVVQGKHIARTRPQFFDWETAVTCSINTEQVSVEDFVRIAETAGEIEGVGDGRPFYGGRFSVELVS